MPCINKLAAVVSQLILDASVSPHAISNLVSEVEGVTKQSTLAGKNMHALVILIRELADTS